MLNLVNDIYKALDKNEYISMVLLDYSKAFDSVDHDTLLSYLESIGCSDKTHKLFQSINISYRLFSYDFNNCFKTIPIKKY